MRAAAIFGPRSSEKDLKPFQNNSYATWLTGLPAGPEKADAILIFGGDGTVHRHLEALVELQLPVLVVPCGSGNDFARALKLKKVKDAVGAWRKFAAGENNVRAIDLGTIMQSGAGNQHYFCCVAGLGLDSEVARRASRLPRWLRAHGGYAFTLPSTLLYFVPFPMKLSVPDPGEPGKFVLRCEKLTILVAFANAPSYGGGMRIAPQAKLDDGQLDICLIADIDKMKLFCRFPTVYFGRHLRLPEVKYFQTSSLRVKTERPLEVYADGEYVCQTPVEVGIARSALKVIIPPD